VDVWVYADPLSVVLTALDLGHGLTGIAKVERHDIIVGQKLYYVVVCIWNASLRKQKKTSLWS
jgi:hypothetical protein